MKKQFKQLIIVAALWLLFFTGQAFAASLAVQFQATPLFSEANIVPGDGIARTVTVTNQGEVLETVEVFVQNNFSDGLAPVLDFKVAAPGVTYFSGTLSEFFATTPLALGTLAPGATRVYTFSASLPADIGNAVSLKQAGFDLIIGFVGGEQLSDTPERLRTGGGGSSSQTLTIFNERVAEVSVAEGNARVTWNSNLPASSYLVCGAIAQGPYTLTTTPPLFGYQFMVEEVESNDVNHSLLVAGLVPTDYECRPAGRRSPVHQLTVGQPVNFGFPGRLVAGATTSALVGTDNQVTPSELPVGQVLGEQVSRWPLGGLALGMGGSGNRIIVLVVSILLLVFLTFWLRRRSHG